MKILRIAFLLSFPFYFISCSNQKKTPYYLENSRDTAMTITSVMPELRIQKDDLLSIQVYSASTIPEIDMLYNLPAAEGTALGGFLVDANGNIEYPRLGTIKAEGLTKKELSSEIKKKLTEPVELLRNPSVIIRFLNYKITVLGMVGREGPITLAGEKVTILEAIGLAGGITEFGKKDRVKVIRETDGKREIAYVDLTTNDVFESPYYNLMQNDVLIVEPTKARQKETDQAKTAQRVSFALSVITAAAFIYNIFK